MNHIGTILGALRSACGLSQTQLARLSGVRRGSICQYENGKVMPDSATLSRLLEVMGLSWSALDRAAEFLDDIAADRATRRPLAGGPAAGRAARRSEALRLLSAEFGAANARLGRSLMTLALDAVEEHQSEDRPRPPVPRHTDRDAVPALWADLEDLPLESQQALVRTDPLYRSWALCEYVCFESERRAAADPTAAVALGTLAVTIAEECSGPAGWCCRLRAFAVAHLGNAWKVAGKMPEAAQCFAAVAEWWSVGPEADPANLLDEAWVLALMASYQVVHRHRAAAEDLILKALAWNPRPLLRGRLLVLQARALEESGEWDAAIECLTDAMPFADPEADPRLYLCIRHNLVCLLAQCGRASEAKQLLPEVFNLSRLDGTSLDQTRLVWVAAKIAVEQGDSTTAVELFLQVRGVFAERSLSFDTALVSLELAALYATENRTEEVKTIARSLVPIFQANDLPKETLAALTLFRQAAEKEEVTAELARRLAAYVHRAQFNPELRFR
jgi:transcriptional regulator with XRE-family HTH domain